MVALDVKTGTERWRYRHQLKSKKIFCGSANRGPALTNGKAYTVTIYGRLIALNQTNGKPVWT